MLFALIALGGVTGIFFKNTRKKRKKKIDLLEKSNNNTQAVVSSEAEKVATHQQKMTLGAASLLGLGALTSPVFTLAGLPLLGYSYVYMLSQSYQAYLKKKSFLVMLYDSLSITITLLLGYFFITAVLFALLFTASRLVAKTEREAQIDFSRIFGELSKTVWLLHGDIEIEVPLENVQIGDIVIVRVGDMIPVDGSIASGEGTVDQHLLTGESQPAEKKQGDSVLTSTLLISGSLNILVEKCGADTLTGQIAKTLEHTATFKHKVESRGNQLVEKGALRTILATAASTPLLGFSHAMALTYSGFGYQMRVAAPLMLLNYLRLASSKGILIKNGQALDVLHQLDTIVFDKTGTLTEEVPQIERIMSCKGFTEKEVLQYAASAEQYQAHPIAQAVCQTAAQQSVVLFNIVNSTYAIGYGLRVELEAEMEAEAERSQHIIIGSHQFMHTEGVTIPSSIETMQMEAGEKGYSVIYIASNVGVLMGAIALRPTLRPQAQATIDALNAMGITSYIISGDQEKPTRHLADSLGINHYFSETLPTEKAAHIKHLQSEGKKVGFIGDGINDSVALQCADVAISLQGAATIAQDTADIVLMTPDLMHLPYLVTLSSELQQCMDKSVFINNSSTAISVSSIFLLGIGIPSAILIYTGSYLINIANAMSPLLSPYDKNNKDDKHF